MTKLKENGPKTRKLNMFFSFTTISKSSNPRWKESNFLNLSKESQSFQNSILIFRYEDTPSVPKSFPKTNEQVQKYQKDDGTPPKINWNEWIYRSPFEVGQTNLMLSPSKPNFIETNCSLPIKSLSNWVFGCY